MAILVDGSVDVDGQTIGKYKEKSYLLPLPTANSKSIPPYLCGDMTQGNLPTM